MKQFPMCLFAYCLTTPRTLVSSIIGKPGEFYTSLSFRPSPKSSVKSTSQAGEMCCTLVLLTAVP